MGKARNDLEYERFTTASDGNTAVRVVVPDGLSVNVNSSDIQIGAVEIKDATSSERVSVSSGKLNVADSSTLAELQTLNSLVPSKYDYVALAYDTSSLLTSATFKLGGSTGSTVSTINLGYTGSDKTVDLNTQKLRFSTSGSDRIFELNNITTNETSSTGSNFYILPNSPEYLNFIPPQWRRVRPRGKLIIGESGSDILFSSSSSPGDTKNKINTYMHGNLDVEGSTNIGTTLTTRSLNLQSTDSTGGTAATINFAYTPASSPPVQALNFYMNEYVTYPSQTTSQLTSARWVIGQESGGDFYIEEQGLPNIYPNKRYIRLGKSDWIDQEKVYRGVEALGELKSLYTSGSEIGFYPSNTEHALASTNNINIVGANYIELLSNPLLTDSESAGYAIPPGWTSSETASPYPGNGWYTLNSFYGNQNFPHFFKYGTGGHQLSALDLPEAGKNYRLTFYISGFSTTSECGLDVSCGGISLPTISTSSYLNDGGIWKRFTKYFRATSSDALTFKPENTSRLAVSVGGFSLEEFPSLDVDIYGSIKADDYKASDGSSGLTTTKEFYGVNLTGGNILNTVTIKNGLITDWTQV